MKTSNYDKSPCTVVTGFEKEVFAGYDEIIRELKEKCKGRMRTVITVECYPGIRLEEIINHFREGLSPAKVIIRDECS